MNSVRKLFACTIFTAILLLLLPLSNNLPSAYAQITEQCQITSQAPTTNSVFLFSDLNPNFHYRIRLEPAGTLQGVLIGPTITGVTQYAFAIPASYPDGEYLMDVAGFDSAANAQNATPNFFQSNGMRSICSQGDGFTLSRGQTPVTPPPNAETCEPGADGFTIESPVRSTYFVNEDITASTIIHNCETIGIFYQRNNSDQETVGNYGGDTRVTLNGNSNVTANLKFLAEGEWRVNAYLLTGGSPILENDLIINVIPRPELEGVPDRIAPGESVSFEVINCPAPMELRLDGERINEDAELSRTDSTTVSVTIPGSFFEEEGDYTVDATCAGGNTDEETITVDEDEEEETEEAITCPVCPDTHKFFDKGRYVCCSLFGCQVPASVRSLPGGDIAVDAFEPYITRPTTETCEERQICWEGKGCIIAAQEPSDPPCYDSEGNPTSVSESGNCDQVRFGDRSLFLSFPTTPAGFIQTVLGLLLSVSGMVAVALIIRSGYQYMTSSGNPDAIQEARDRLTAAIIGLLFIIFSLVILQVIGVDILQIPGFGN